MIKRFIDFWLIERMILNYKQAANQGFLWRYAPVRRTKKWKWRKY